MIKKDFEELPLRVGVGDVFRYILRHPFEVAVLRWNWKAALLSGIMRGMIYFFTHIKLGWRAALSAMSVEFVFRVLNSGISASVTQLFRRASPIWLSTFCVIVLLPTYSHAIEFALHTISGDQNKNKSIIVSISFSVLSAVFTLFAMRRGALLVNEAEQGSLKHDMLKMPAIIGEFIFYPAIWLWRTHKKRNAEPISARVDGEEQKF